MNLMIFYEGKQAFTVIEFLDICKTQILKQNARFDSIKEILENILILRQTPHKFTKAFDVIKGLANDVLDKSDSEKSPKDIGKKARKAQYINDLSDTTIYKPIPKYEPKITTTSENLADKFKCFQERSKQHKDELEKERKVKRKEKIDEHKKNRERTVIDIYNKLKEQGAKFERKHYEYDKKNDIKREFDLFFLTRDKEQYIKKKEELKHNDTKSLRCKSYNMPNGSRWYAIRVENR